MHLLQARTGAVTDGEEAVDLGQSPGDILYLTAADTELASLATALAALPDDFPSVRLANLMHLGHPMSVDLYVDEIVRHARLVVVRVLGGVGYWNYGVEQVAGACRSAGIPVAFLPGDDKPDEQLTAHGTLAADVTERLWHYAVHGGPANAHNLLAYCASLVGHDSEWLEPVPLPRVGLYWPGATPLDLDDMASLWTPGQPVVAITFYRALAQAANLAPIDALVESLVARGLNPLPIYCASLKDGACAEVVSELLADAGTHVILNATAFAIGSPGEARSPTPFDAADCPVLQVVFSGGNEVDWTSGTQGMGARDIAMNVALPEVDGRLLTRAVSFKSEARFDERSQCAVVSYAVQPDRIDFVVDLAGRWAHLRALPAAERRVAVVLANYPNRDGRLGNGVGLDTPAGTVELLNAMAAAGYDVTGVPATGNALVERLREGPTNAGVAARVVSHTLDEHAYARWFATLPREAREAVIERWGPPGDDPFHDGEGFAIPAFSCGRTLVCLQPARGYNIDPSATYHDPALVPPHGYLAFYAYLQANADVVVHMGKHGNLEWLPGKALALSSACFPEAALGPLPHVYPFIVNDPGEGTQAKRRAQAVIIDHLTPPLTRAETYGPLAELERLVDEYYEASGTDPRRLRVLRDEILSLTGQTGLDADCGIVADDDADAALGKLDNYLCELKELQIRDGLHVFGRSPEGRQLDDLLVALCRVPRGEDSGASASLTRALARDLALDFDPLDCEMGTPWTGDRPAALGGAAGWRTTGDTVERIEVLASRLVAGESAPDLEWLHTRAVLDDIESHLRPTVRHCGNAELDGVLRALAGRFVAPGPSGAPTRGRPEVLPTGRNFYSVDTRTVPTPAAWQLGWQSASLLVERYRQEHGEWPRRMVLTAWGTSNMRTGGDDLAQALALMGVKPKWEPASRRITGFEILPVDLLDRPRVDVTLRISGFFRDAFPTQIDLLDSAVRAVAELDEPDRDNPLAAAVRDETAELVAAGQPEEQARRRAGFRVFGAMPGAYGAGLQALIDERGWEDESDLAEAWLVWGSYAYGAGAGGASERERLETRLRRVQAVVHNQDNREHDLLDSDDYYQFEGGLAATVRHLSGEQPAIYHNDHSRPERPRIRRLEEEIAMVVRARVVNPKWIRSVMRHGYKGAFEMAATVDYLFAFAATARVVADHHFDAVHEAYIEDDEVRGFLAENNDAALADIASRLLEAQTRGLWQPRSNSARSKLEQLARSLRPQ